MCLIFTGQVYAKDHNATHLFSTIFPGFPGGNFDPEPDQANGNSTYTLANGAAHSGKVLDEVYLALTFKTGEPVSLSRAINVSYGADIIPGSKFHATVSGQVLYLWYGFEDRAQETKPTYDALWNLTVTGTSPLSKVETYISYHGDAAGEMPDLFSNTNLRVASVNSIQTETGAMMGEVLTPSDGKKLIVFVHGWNPEARINHYAAGGNKELFGFPSGSGWKNLGLSLLSNPVVVTGGWRVARYDWALDAATGPVSIFHPIDTVNNANAARDAANAHGWHLAQLIRQNAPTHVQFIAHSAGNWAARRAAAILKTLDHAILIELTALDPFVNGGVGINLLPSFEMTPSWIDRCENYYVDDDWLASRSDLIGWTSGDYAGFNNQRLESLLPFGSAYYYDNWMKFHGGPIEWYAQTAGRTNLSSRDLLLFGGDGIGFLNSLAVREASPNDSFSNPAVLDAQLSGPSPIWFNYRASKEASEPDHGGDSGGRSVWGLWPGPSAGEVTIKTYGSDFYTSLAVYTGSTIGSLMPVGSDTSGGKGNGLATVAFNAVAGQTYRIAVDGLLGQSGKIVLNTSFVAAGVPAPIDVTINAPVSGATMSGVTAVSATASGATSMEFYLDGELQYTSTAEPFIWNWNTAQVLNGVHAVSARAYAVGDLLGASSATSVTVSNSTPTPVVDDYGNSSTQASAVSLGTPVQGLISSATDVDWFKVEVATPGVLAFSLTVPAGKDYDLELFGPDVDYLRGSYGDTGASESITYNATATGTYYIRVYGYPVGNGSFSATDSYSLTSSFTSGVVADPSIPTSNFNNGSLFVQSSQLPAVIRVTQDGLAQSMAVPFSLVAAKGTILSMDAPPDTSTSRFVGWLVDGSVVSSHSLTMAIPASGVVTLLTETVSSGGNSVPATGAAWQITGPSEVMGGQTASFKLTSTDEHGATIEANAASWDLSSDGYGSIDYMGNFTAKAGLASQVQLRVFAWAAGSTTNDRIEKQILLLPAPGENYHTVEIFDSPGGSVTLSPEPLIVGGEYVYREGTIVEVLATPDSGKSLKDWGDAALTENPLLFTVTENRILRPNFVSTALLTGPKHITIEKPSGLGRVTITAPRFTHIMERGETRFSSAEISHGEKVYVRVDVDPTEEFIGWLGSGQGAAARFTMVEHVSLVARMRSRLTSLANSSLSRNIEMITYHNLLADGYHAESPDYQTNIIDNGEVIRAQMTAAPRPGLSDSFMDAYLIFQHPELNRFPLHVNSASLKLFPPATAPSIETWVRLYLPSEVLNMPSSATSPAENWSSLPTAIDFGFPLVYSYRWQPLVLGITDQFNGWRSGVLANNGLILRCMRSGYEAMYYASNASEPLVRPVLLLNWDEDAAPLAAPIVISRSPNVLRLAAQQTATLLVDVASDSAVSYKWFRDGQQVIPGSSNQLQIVAVNAATYTVEATNDTGSTTESFAIEILDTTAPQIIADKAIWRTDQLGRVVVTGQALDDRSVSRLAVQSHTVSTVLSGLENWQVEVMAPSGTHYLNIGVFDAAGNMSEVTVLVVNPVGDVVPPLVQASATRLSNGHIEVTWQVTDNTGAARIQMMASNYLVYEQNDPFNIGKAEFSVPSHATQIEITAVDLAGNSAGIVLGIVAAELPATSNFDTWRFDAFTSEETANVQISGPNAVYGHDGLPNLVKYALGLEPKQNITTGLPEVSIVGSDWVYTYVRPSDRTDVAYAVEISTDLVNWSTTGVIHELASSVGATETWRARFPISSATKVFFRLRVSN